MLVELKTPAHWSRIILLTSKTNHGPTRIALNFSIESTIRPQKGRIVGNISLMISPAQALGPPIGAQDLLQQQACLLIRPAHARLYNGRAYLRGRAPAISGCYVVTPLINTPVATRYRLSIGTLRPLLVLFFQKKSTQKKLTNGCHEAT